MRQAAVGLNFIDIDHRSGTYPWRVERDLVIDFLGAHYLKSVIRRAVLFHLRYAVSYHDLEEIMAKRGVMVDHFALNCWVVKFAP